MTALGRFQHPNIVTLYGVCCELFPHRHCCTASNCYPAQSPHPSSHSQPPPGPIADHTDGSNAVSIVEELAERDLCDCVGNLAATGGTLPLVWQLKFGLDVARAVAYMHANSVSHCGELLGGGFFTYRKG